MLTKINNRKNMAGEVTRIEIRWNYINQGKYICSVRPEAVETVRYAIERTLITQGETD